LAAEKYAQDPLPATAKEARLRVQADIAEYDLGAHVADLETRGYTILAPGRGAPKPLTDALRDTILRVADQREVDSLLGPNAGLGRTMFHLLPEDPIFEQAVMNPVSLTLLTYLAGYRARLSQTTGLIKTNESDAALAFHCDASGKLPAPWPAISQTANVTYALTDYDRANGALCVVPGSHLSGQPPPADFSHDHEDVEVIEAPAGSLIVWHSNLWHAAVPRTAEGTRVTLVVFAMRSYMRTQEDYGFSTTPEMIERNAARFGVLTGLLGDVPWPGAGPRLPSPAAASPFVANFGRWS
jgi:hypothetical protein